VAEKHIIRGPDGRAIDPKLAARLSSNPHLLLGHLAGRAGGAPNKPKMQIDIAVSDESIKAAEAVIKGLRDEANALKPLIDDLIGKATELQKQLEAVRDAVHS